VARCTAKKGRRKQRELAETQRMVEAFDTPHMLAPSHRAHYPRRSANDSGKGVRAVVDIASGTPIRGLSFHGKVLTELEPGMCVMHVRQVHVDGEDWTMFIASTEGSAEKVCFLPLVSPHVQKSHNAPGELGALINAPCRAGCKGASSVANVRALSEHTPSGWVVEHHALRDIAHHEEILVDHHRDEPCTCGVCASSSSHV
jgi:hypothetical protein